MTYTVGSLVKARGREWVVLPDSTDDLLVLRPLGGSDDEIAGIYIPLEPVAPATFDLPDPSQVGDYRSARLLRDAVRLGFRSSAGPFRSFARVGFEPRPYQLVPLLMALKLDPIRLLVADDVGIGKTIEAGLIARELLDRGEIERLAVLCPPPLAEQWQSELRDKFHIEAELVLPSTAARLERNLSLGESLFERYPFVIVSMDYIKSDRRREEFKRACPEFIIVDEAHTCAYGAERGGRHKRFEMVRGLAQNPDRHIVLVTATPHSGKEEAFRSLLTFLDKEFDDLPEDLTGEENLRHRRHLAQHFIQRRRGDIQNYMDSKTPFPRREDREDSYKLSPEYKRLFERVLDYARESVLDATGGQFHQRVRWWSALALLRSLASSPAAA
ncbi:MAG: DEAD/DEAH box helicase, partial [Syntrophobacter sp.]